MQSLRLKAPGLCTGKPAHLPHVLVNHRAVQQVSFRTRSSVVEGKTTNRPYYPYSEGPIIVDGQVAHSMSHERFEIINSLDNFLKKDVLKYLKPIKKIWQPADFLPLPESDNFMEEVKELRERVKCLPLEYLVVLVGDMITEEALPTYMAMLNTLDGVRDETGAQKTAWGQWTRQWVAEENRHGDLLNKYLYLTGLVDLRKIEVTIQNLITSGMDPKTENNAYLGFIYTSFQERATKISHGNTAKKAQEYGDEVLASICGIIASDESRHELAYKRIIEELFRLDPNGTMLAFHDMMRKQIVMPAHLMDDGEHELKNGRKLFADFSEVAERLGVYTATDYCSIIEHLIERWNVKNITGLSADGLQAQESVCLLPNRFKKLSERLEKRKRAGKATYSNFSWIFDQPVLLHGTTTSFS
eukprot:g1833.t1